MPFEKRNQKKRKEDNVEARILFVEIFVTMVFLRNNLGYFANYLPMLNG